MTMLSLANASITVMQGADHGLTSSPDALPAIPLRLIAESDWQAVLATLPAHHQSWATGHQFKAAVNSHCLLPDRHGRPAEVLVGIGKQAGLWTLAALPATLPEGTYYLADCPALKDASGELLEKLALGWMLGGYHYRAMPPKTPRPPVILAMSAGVNLKAVHALATSIAWVRDLIMTPANQMGPEQLANEAAALAKQFGASLNITMGEELERGFPLIHAVGKASTQSPRLICINWGQADKPLVALVGKGVCFDTGGLNLKPGKYMLTMKMDMGGAAHVLGLAKLIMTAQLPIRLLVVIPAVENAIGGNAMRPSDVIKSRSGQTVEVENTDAEGRLILADALHYAGEQEPELIIDFATLTGSAVVALGGEIGVFLSNDDKLASDALAFARVTEDPLWQLPLWEDYLEQLESKSADLLSCTASGDGDAILAGLFLQKFVPTAIPWIHLDVNPWHDNDRPGRPKGGGDLGVRAIYKLLQQRYAA
ncbi:MAG: leucyl aminopeptidase family protein [Alphaproteobacteria bacterium]|nr:leucyl aminopeptidase family protein [Alphaproteobacteria bacterium]